MSVWRSKFEEERGFEMLIDRVERVRDRACRRGGIDLHRDRGVEDVVGQPPDIVRHGCREHQRLALGRNVLDDLPDIRQEAHVEHPVRLVEHEHLQVRQADRALLDVIEQAAGTGDDDLDAGAQFLYLRVHGHAAVDRDAAHVRLAAQVGNGGVDLLCQLARRGDDEGADAATRSF